MNLGGVGPTLRGPDRRSEEGARMKPTGEVQESWRPHHTWRCTRLEGLEEKWLSWHDKNGVKQNRVRWRTSSRPLFH